MLTPYNPTFKKIFTREVEKRGKHGAAYQDSFLKDCGFTSLPSRSKGAVVEGLVRACINGLPSKNSEWDVTLGDERIEVKSSTVWKSGSFRFQQIRPGHDFSSILLIGLAPDGYYAWYMPKQVILQHTVSQHAGGHDTEWLAVDVLNIPDWLSQFAYYLPETST